MKFTTINELPNVCIHFLLIALKVIEEFFNPLREIRKLKTNKSVFEELRHVQMENFHLFFACNEDKIKLEQLESGTNMT